MSDSEFLRKMMPGDPVEFSRIGHNKTVDAVKKATQQHGQDAGAGFRVPRGTRSPGLVSVVNRTGEHIPIEFAIVCLGDAPIAPGDNEREFTRGPLFEGLKATAETLERFAILQAPAVIGQVVDAVVIGVTICKVDVKDDEHQYAKPVTTTGVSLESASSGPVKILWKAEGTGVQWATVLVRASEEGAKPYMLAEGITYPDGDGSPTTTGWPALSSGEEGDTSWYIDDTAEPELIYYNDAPVDADGYFLGVPLYGEGKWVWCTRVNGLLEIQAPHEPAGPWLVELDDDLEAGGDTTGTLVLPEEMGVESPPSLPIHDDILPEPEGEDEPETIDAGTRLKVMWSDIHRAFTPMVQSCATPPPPEA